jgi:phosphatidylserine decarboxylase
VKNVFKLAVYSNLIGVIYVVKYSDKNTKWNISLTRRASELYGMLFRLNVPMSWRLPLYKGYCSLFMVDLNEINKPLEEFENLNELFTRKLKEGARVIDKEPLVSPCDGRIKSLGVVQSTLDSIKGRKYSFTTFLTSLSDDNFEDYKSSLKKNPENELYYITIYLSPGDYHRFHAPADWEVTYRRHLYGYLLGVFDLNMLRKKNIFTINERVVYFGKWKYGALHYVAVGAYNVGSISVSCDPSLITNKFEFANPFDNFEQTKLEYKAQKGEEFGVFNTGSTIVLIFEAPKDIEWKVKVGDLIKVGNKLTNLE